MYYGMNLLNEQPLYRLSDMLSNIEKVQMDDIRTVISQIFRSENLVIGTIGKVSGADSEKIKTLVNNF